MGGLRSCRDEVDGPAALSRFRPARQTVHTSGPSLLVDLHIEIRLNFHVEVHQRRGFHWMLVLVDQFPSPLFAPPAYFGFVREQDLSYWLALQLWVSSCCAVRGHQMVHTL